MQGLLFTNDREKYIEVYKNQYGEFFETFHLKQYENLDPNKLIQEIITKFENNKVGIQFNQTLSKVYFTNEKRKAVMESLAEYIKSVSDSNDQRMYFETLDKCIKNERNRSEIKDVRVCYDEIMQSTWYRGLQDMFKDRTLEQIIQSENYQSDKGYVADIIRKISQTDYYKGNKHHSIEHIQKVILFSEILAKGENLTEEDTQLLLISAAFHDSGRKGLGDNNIHHGEPSARKAGAVLTNESERWTIDGSKFNSKDISIIQTIIEYHDCRDKERGKVDIDKICDIFYKYIRINEPKSKDKISIEDIERIVKMCMLVKDADSLDRCRFAGSGQLNPNFLRSETAKKTSIVSFAKQLNDRIAKKILEENYGVFSLRDRDSAVYRLNKERLKNRKRRRAVKEKSVPIETVLEEFGLHQIQEFSKSEPSEIVKSLLQTYLDKETTFYELKEADREINEKTSRDINEYEDIETGKYI